MPFININGRDLHVTDHPPSSESSTDTSVETPAVQTIIFIHGLGSTQNFYQTVIPYLDKYRCITFDNYGAGRSKYLATTYPETSIESIARDVLGILDFFKVDKAIVVGFSMGGMIPTHLAADSKGSSRVVAGVCIGPVHPSPNAAEVFEERIKKVTEEGMDPMANTIPSKATGPKTTPVQKALIREMLLSQDPKGYIANCRAISTAKPPEYAKVTCPVLIIAGELDKSAPLEGCRFIHEHLGTDERKKHLEVLSGVGHWIGVEDGDGAGDLIRRFVESL